MVMLPTKAVRKNKNSNDSTALNWLRLFNIKNVKRAITKYITLNNKAYRKTNGLILLSV